MNSGLNRETDRNTDLSIRNPVPVRKDSAIRNQTWRVWVPAVVLVVVAMTQMLLARTTALSPWKGGGFGMFSTTDGIASRYVRVFVQAPGRSEELGIAPSQEFAAGRAQLFPSDAMMTGLARAVVAREQRYNRPVHTVRLELWRIEFKQGSLDAMDRPVRIFTYVDQEYNKSRH